MSPDAGNRNVVRGRATRDHLVDVATRLFTDDGYDATPIGAVLVQAGASKGSLYHHFPGGKEDLFLAVLHRLGERIDAELAEAARDAPGIVAALRAGCLAWIRLTADPTVRRVMLIDAPAVLGWQRFREYGELSTLGRVRAALTVAAGEGRLDMAHVDAFAHIMMAAVDEVALMIARSDDPDGARRDGEAAIGEFLDRLLGREATSGHG